MTISSRQPSPWSDVRDQLRARGLRWTPQRRSIIEVLAGSHGHVTGGEVIERCRERDPETTPSTVYRTLEVLEELGYLNHSHASDGRGEYHVLPATEHAHLHCEACGHTWEVEPDEVRGLVDTLHAQRAFEVTLGHLTIAGRCADCASMDSIFPSPSD
jgi:Fur family transcriptional regulator, ferric uptake regulator